MKKNIIIGVLSAIIIIMALFSYSQKNKAEKMAKIAIELTEQAEMQRAIAEEQKATAEDLQRAMQIAMEESQKSAEKARIEADKKNLK